MTDLSWDRPWSSGALFLPLDDVDTDQIIPARYLKGTGSDGLGDHLFADWRYGEGGAPRPDFVLNRRPREGERILVAGRNFGCGSSREHAAWALVDFGFRAIVARSFADIFRTNALKNGLVPIAVDADSWTALTEHLVREPSLRLEVDLPNQRVRFGSRETPFTVDPFARHCLVEAVDELGFLLAHESAIAAYEQRACSGS